MSSAPEIFIGFPVFNGASHIAHALDCFLAQTYPHWKMLISDNCSTDGTADICKHYASIDSRISCVRQEKNIGMAGNYQFVLQMADCPFFMWAAYDDHWEPDFLKKCIEPLKQNSRLGMSFCNIFTFDWNNEKALLDYNLKLLTGKSTFGAIFKNILSPGGAGKANLMYSIYRTPVAKEAFARRPIKNEFASDTAFAVAAIAIGGITVHPEKLFGKRMPPANEPDHSLNGLLTKCLGKLNNFKLQLGDLLNQSRALKGTRYYIPAAYLTCARIMIFPLLFVLEGLKLFPGKYCNYKTITPSSTRLKANV
ncbi:MAG TPA: glycosyltransferase family A protein [Candidatus Rifleibacterium sp.]|nr:glycosyltransferase family A protein [Candidatus Rifleibacterium sp.]HPT47883.1 glycosyltransferase family A protein [Candidatus Rifleibacterium sp.]